MEAPLLYGQLGLWVQVLHISLPEEYSVCFLQMCFLVFSDVSSHASSQSVANLSHMLAVGCKLQG